MMNTAKKAISLALSLTLSLSLLTGCSLFQTAAPQEDVTPDVSTSTETVKPEVTPEVEPEKEDVPPPAVAEPTPDPLNLVVLAGPTGVGAAKLMADNDADATAIPYNVTVTADNSEVSALLLSGDADIAAVATNVASTLYNKKDDFIQILGVNTLGVLYVLEKGTPTVSDFSDLAGKTIWTTGQGANPEYTLNYLLEQNGLTPGEDVTIQFMTPSEVSAKMLESDTGICMLPVPASTALMMQDSAVTEVLNLDSAWSALTDTSLTMGCVVVRTDYLKENPQAVSTFMEEYEASISFIADSANVDEASALVANYKITPNAKIASLAIPKCGLTFLTGSSMRASLQPYYEMLFAANPASIGGAMPYDDLYYNP